MPATACSTDVNFPGPLHGLGAKPNVCNSPWTGVCKFLPKIIYIYTYGYMIVMILPIVAGSGKALPATYLNLKLSVAAGWNGV